MRYWLVSSVIVQSWTLRAAMPEGCKVVRELSDMAVLVECPTDLSEQVPALELDPVTAQLLLRKAP